MSVKATYALHLVVQAPNDDALDRRAKQLLAFWRQIPATGVEPTRIVRVEKGARK